MFPGKSRIRNSYGHKKIIVVRQSRATENLIILNHFQTTNMTSDPIADLLTRIRNAIMARKNQTVVPYSKLKMEILRVMKEKGFILDVEETKSDNFREIMIVFKSGEKYRLNLKRVSKPGQRIYVKSKQLKKVHGGLGVGIISTPQGIMSAEQARRLKLGGELLCEIYQ